MFMALFHQCLRFLSFEEFNKNSKCNLLNQALLTRLLDKTVISVESSENPVIYWVKIS